YGYDSAGRLDQLTAPDGTRWDYTLDDLGRITEITPGYRVADTFTGPNGSAPDTSKWASSGTASGAATINDNQLRLYVASVVASTSTAGSSTTVSTASDRDIRFDYVVDD